MGQRRGGFTLIELLVVIVIILIVSVVALPTVVHSLNRQGVDEAARIVQAAIVGARDAAIHAGAPRGIRLLPDPSFFTASTNGKPSPARLADGSIDPASPLASNRIIPIEPGPDYSEGRVNAYVAGSYTWTSADTPPWPPYPGNVGSLPARVYPVEPMTTADNKVIQVLTVVEAPFGPLPDRTPNPPTSWFWNVRVGDRIQLGDAGRYYTIVGPMTVGPLQGNVERFVNDGPAGSPGTLQTVNPFTGAAMSVEFLFLTNGLDDDGNGFIDDGWDGIDENPREIAGTDELDEWETEKFIGSQTGQSLANAAYSIRRRAVASIGTRDAQLPGQTVVDLTTWSATLERSRLPVDPMTGQVDILIDPSGAVVPSPQYSSPAASGLNAASYYFWITGRDSVAAPLDWTAHPTFDGLFHLPMPAGTPNLAGGDDYETLRARDPAIGELKGDRVLVTLNGKTGEIGTAELSVFDAANVSRPFLGKIGLPVATPTP